MTSSIVRFDLDGSTFGLLTGVQFDFPSGVRFGDRYVLTVYPIQETPPCDETRFSMLQPSIDMTGIRNERWQ